MSADNQQATVGWLAGIFDTDGCFGIRLGHNQVLTPFASVSNANPLIIEAVADVLSSVGRHVGWKNNGNNAKRLGIVQVVGLQRLVKLFALFAPFLKTPQYDLLKDYVARRLALPRGSAYEQVDYEMRAALQKKPFLEPQRLHAMLSIYDQTFLSAWLAGAIDGDGSISLRSSKQPFNGQFRVCCDVQVHGTQAVTMDAVQWIARSLGSDFSVYQRKQRNGHAIFRAQTGSERRSEPLLQGILPYLKGKRRQAELVLDFIHYRDTVPFHTPHGDYERLLQKQVWQLNVRGDEDIV